MPARPSADRRDVRAAARRRRRVEAAERSRAAGRRRRAPILVAGVLAVLLIGGPAVLAFSPVFAVAAVAVPGASGSTATAVRRALAAQVGRPLALVGDGDVADALRRVPTVETFAVVRRPPSTLEVRVTERTAVAQQRTGGVWQRVDAARVALSAGPTQDAALPVVAVPAGAAGDRSFRSAVAAIAALHGVGIDPTRIRATSEDDVVVTVGSHRVRWGGAEDGSAKARALRAALVRAAAGATVIDVSSPGVVQTR